MNLILSGFACAGKTSIGRILSQRLQFPFIDIDEQIGDIRKYFSQGEDVFRRREQEVVLSLASIKKSVIALGGGTLLDQESYLFLRQRGKICYLKTPFEVLFARLLKRGIPLYLDSAAPYESFQRLFSLREPLYEATADVIIDTHGLTFERILFTLQSYYGK